MAICVKLLTWQVINILKKAVMLKRRSIYTAIKRHFSNNI